MSAIELTPDEKKRVDEAAAELDRAIEDFFADARDSLSDGEWERLESYVQACVKRVLEVGTLLHGIVDSRCATGLEYPGRGREVFVRTSLAAWRDSFAPVPEVWNLASVFAAIPGGERRVLADVSTLEVMAANRMFDPLDGQCAALLEEDA